MLGSARTFLLCALAVLTLPLVSRLGKTASEPVSYEAVLTHANRTPSSSAVVVSTAAAPQQMMADSLDFEIPGNPLGFPTPPASFFIDQTGGFNDGTNAMTPYERIEWLEQSIDGLESLHEGLQTFKSNVRPTDQVQAALGDDADGVGAMLRQTYNLLKALSSVPDVPRTGFRGGRGGGSVPGGIFQSDSPLAQSVEAISKLRRFASALDGALILMKPLVEQYEAGQELDGDDLRDLSDLLGDIETSLGFLNGVRVNPVLSAMLTTYALAIDSTAEFVDNVLIPYIRRLRDAERMVDEALGTAGLDDGTGEAIDDALDELNTLIDDLSTQLASERDSLTRPADIDVTAARAAAFRGLNMTAEDYDDLLSTLRTRRHELVLVRRWFRELAADRQSIETYEYLKTIATSQAEIDEYDEQIERLQTTINSTERFLPTKLQELRDAYDGYQSAFDAVETVNSRIRGLLSLAKNADADFLETNYPHFQSEYWELDLRWIREILESPPASADDLSVEPGTFGALFSPNDLDLAETPQFAATRFDDVRANDSNRAFGGPLVLATIRSTGNSTGPDAFNVNVLNLGKPPVHLTGEGVVFEPIEREEYEAIQDHMNSVFPTANVFTGSAGGYCLEKDQRPPAPGEFYALGGADAQQRFEPQRRILAAARTLYQTSALHPDSDDEAYFHSLRQWAIWAKEKGFDRDSFTESFIAHTKSNLEANGQSWSRQIEDNVAALAPNRWSDIEAVLELADTV